MVLHYCNLCSTRNMWALSSIFILLTQIFSGCSCTQSVCQCSHLNSLCGVTLCISLSLKPHFSIITIQFWFITFSSGLFWYWMSWWSWHTPLPHRFCIFLASSLISWCSKHMDVDVVSRSSIKVENCAVADIALELQWLRDLLCGMGVSVITLVPMHCDNKSAIAIASNHVFHDHTKHIEVDYHITRQEYEKRRITLSYVPSGAQLADLFTRCKCLISFT